MGGGGWVSETVSWLVGGLISQCVGRGCINHSLGGSVSHTIGE